MTPFGWMQSLVTFRKSGGGFAVPQLDAAGRIQTTVLSVSPVSVGASAPSTTDGSVLWANTTAGYEGLYTRDLTRSKWLADETRYSFSHDSADNQLLRPAGIDTPSANGGYRIPRNGTIVGITALATGGQLDKGFEVRVNGASVLSTALVAGVVTNTALDIDVAAANRLEVFAVAAGNAVNDIVFDVLVRWRG